MYQSCSLSASPASPPNSNSTEGGHGSEKDSLEVNEESDMEMVEHSGLTKSPHYGNVAHGSDSNDDKMKLDGEDSNDELVIAEKSDQHHFGETLDLSSRKKDGVYNMNLDSNFVQTSLPLVAPSTPLIHSHITTSAVLEAALKGSERDRNKDRSCEKSELNGPRNCSVIGNCPHCKKEYSNLSSLKYHVRLIHSEASNQLCCFLCPTAFVSRTSFKEHLLKTHGVKNH